MWKSVLKTIKVICLIFNYFFVSVFLQYIFKFLQPREYLKLRATCLTQKIYFLIMDILFNDFIKFLQLSA